MVGKSENLSGMWAKIRGSIDLEPETELAENVYLGCNQREVHPEMHWVNDKNAMFRKLTVNAFAGGDSRAVDPKNQKNQRSGDSTLSPGEMILAGATPASPANPIRQQTKPKSELGIMT